MENKDTKMTTLKRKVASLMPISTDPSKTIETMKIQSRTAFAAIDGYGFKEVYNACRIRQDQQKYVRQNSRAEKFLEQNKSTQSRIDNIDERLTQFYNKMRWDQTDKKKVC